MKIGQRLRLTAGVASVVRSKPTFWDHPRHRATVFTAIGLGLALVSHSPRVPPHSRIR